MSAKRRRTRRPNYRPVPQRRPQARPDGRTSRVLVDPADAERRAIALRARWARYRRVRTAGWGLLGLALLIAVLHSVDHWQVLHLFDQQLEDLTIGYPTAGVLALLAAICLGQLDPAEQRR